MTAKRFTHKEDDWEILDNGEHLAYAHSGYQAYKICKLLNELHDEKEEIYKYINEQINISYKELKFWENSRLNNLDEKVLKKNQTRREKQIFIKEIEIMCLYNLLHDFGKEDLVDWYE